MRTMTPEHLAPAAAWTVVLPVKGGPTAKSRLQHPRRPHLARAFALDAVTAVLSCASVATTVVVTGDRETAAAHAPLGAQVVVDPGAGLAGALQAGYRAADPDRPCALLLADLPSLRPLDLVRALTACEAVLRAGAAQATVPDADGSGTVLLAALRPSLLRPRFGAGSAAAHAAEAHVVADAPARLRRDVDTDEHLAEALALGVGAATAAVLAGSGQPRSTMAPREASFSPKCS